MYATWLGNCRKGRIERLFFMRGKFCLYKPSRYECGLRLHILNAMFRELPVGLIGGINSSRPPGGYVSNCRCAAQANAEKLWQPLAKCFCLGVREAKLLEGDWN